MQNKGLWILIVVMLLFSTFNAFNYWNIKQTFSELKEVNAWVERKNDKNIDFIKMDAIYGYVVGYLNSTNQKLITGEMNDFAYLTVEYAREFKINPYDCLTICQIENGFNLHKVGSRGEQGPAQLMRNTWNIYYRRFGFHPDDFYQWRCNYRVAMAHFAELLRQNRHNVGMAIGEYNGGGAWAGIASSRRYVQRFQVAHKGISKLPESKWFK